MGIRYWLRHAPCYNPAVKLLVFIIGVAALICGSAPAERQMSAAKLKWQGPPAAAGEVLKARLSFVLVQQLARPGTTWVLRAGADAVPAGLAGVTAATIAPSIDLPFTQYNDLNSKELVLLVDRGAKPQPINSLHLELLAPSLKCTARIAASDDSHGQAAGGAEQLLYQEITGGRILALTDLNVNPAQHRWLRITLKDAQLAEVKKITAQNLTPPPVLRETLAVLGDEIAGKEAGTRIWPVAFGDQQGQISKLEFTADTPGAVCEIALAILDAQQQPLRTIASGIWADRLQCGATQRSAYNLPVTGLDPQGRYGLVVRAGNQPVTFTSAKAYVQDAWIVFAAPASTELTLWLNPNERTLSEHERFDAAQARAVGEFGALMSYAMPGRATPKHSLLPEPLQAAQAGFIRWWRVAAYAAGALVLLLAAVLLLRARVAECDPD
jgi:hypothetical protein